MDNFKSTKIIVLGSTSFRQPFAKSHCRYIHGYRLYAKFWFKCKELDENNWVVDFGGLKQLKLFFAKQFDHTTIISKDDPLLDEFIELNKKGGINLKIMEQGVGIELFAAYCYEQANKHIKKITNERCWVSKVEIFEHEKNSAIYKL
jgi:6-pyruvoyltetrahydropterin/6-carboxytetrahydropterin synthase